MEKEMATHSSILSWKSPWTEEPGGLQSMGLHDWACVYEGGGRWVGSNKLVELKKKKKDDQTPGRRMDVQSERLKDFNKAGKPTKYKKQHKL